MQFSRPLRARIAAGEITCTVRFWQRPRVKTGNRYPVEGGQVLITDLREIPMDDITTELAQQSGFDNVAALLSIARHGSGDNIYLIDFTFEPDVAA
jgi:hypothetical protein